MEGAFYGRQEWTQNATQRSQATGRQLIVEGGTTYHQATQQLGVSDWGLRRWVKAFRDSGHLAGQRADGSLGGRAQGGPRELAQCVWRMNLKKKTRAYFAKESL